MAYEYIEKYKRMAVGTFCHFGLYSILERGEWIFDEGILPMSEYEKLKDVFYVEEDWAERLVAMAKSAGAKYITLTTRHHEGFSLYDTKGLNAFDAPHSACGRDLIAEFVAACRKGGVVPFFYHTLLDWYNPDYQNDFAKYIDYLISSIEILCKNYGEIGGFWFDGMWDKPNENWQEDRLYATIRKYQPSAMIINNTGLSAEGEAGHREIDSVTFERGKTRLQLFEGKPIAGEMCQVLNDHWGYAKADLNYKPIKTFIDDLVDCRKNGCNYLLNTGLRGDGTVCPIDREIFQRLGDWINANEGFVYGATPSNAICEGADVLEDGEAWYIVVKDTPMAANLNVAFGVTLPQVTVDSRIQGKAYWLDDGIPAEIAEGKLTVRPFGYGTSLCARIVKVEKAV